MIMAEMRNFVRRNGLRGYTRYRRRDDLVNFLQHNYQPAPTPAPQPRSSALPSVRIGPDRPRQPQLLGRWEERQPSSQEMDIFKQQEMSKSRP